MTMDQKKALIKELIDCFKQKNVKILITELFKSQEVRKIAINILSDFLMQRMGLHLSKKL